MGPRPSDSENEKVPFEVAIDRTGLGLYSYSVTFVAGMSIISFATISYGTVLIVPVSACELGTTGAQQGAMVAVPTIGTILGSAVWGYLADIKGRRSMLLVSLISAAVINLFVCLSLNWIMMTTLHFIIAFLSAGLYLMGVTILSESVPMAKRNALVVFVACFSQLSQVVMALMALPILPLTFSYYLPALGIYWNSWRSFTIVLTLPCLLTALWTYFFVAETPKFVYAKGDHAKALEILSRIQGVNNRNTGEKYEVYGLISKTQEKPEEKSNTLQKQVLPLFKKPLLKNTLIVTLLLMLQQVGPFSLWMPRISNQFVGILQSGEVEGLTLCSIIRASLDAPSDPDDASDPCAFSASTLWLILGIGLIQATTNTVISLVVNRTGRRDMVIGITSVCGLAGILVNLVPNAYASATLFVVFSMGAIVTGLYNAIIVALYPTHLRALAIALPTVASRIVDIASIQIINLLLTNNCDAAFYLYSTIFGASALIIMLLPNDRNFNKDKQETEAFKENVVETL